MDRQRGSDRGGGERHRGPSRWSDGPPANNRNSSHGHSRGGGGGGGGGGGFEGGGRHHPYRGGGGGGAGGPPDYQSGGSGGHGGFNGGGRHHPYRGGGGSGGAPPDYPSGGVGGFDGGARHNSYRGCGGDDPPDYPSGGGGVAGAPGFRHGPDGTEGFGQVPIGGGQRRGSGFSGGGRGSPDNADSSNFAKLFIGSVPRTATEEDIRPLFEEHGNVIEVALIKDRRTGQQQGCCFVKYATSEEADRAIRSLHNQYTLPGGHGPIQVRYADGERERLGAVEYKLFVGSLNKQATEKEVEEIFSPYGRVEDVYIMKDDMKQSRGCGFVKFSNRDMAAAAIEALNGKYTMRGCEQPLTVRFADPKRPRPGESRGGPAFGGPGYGSRSQPPLVARSTPNLSEGITERRPPNALSGWHPASPHSHIPSSQDGTHDSDLASKSGVPASSSLPGPFGALGGPMNGSLTGLTLISSSMPQQGFSPSLTLGALGQQIPPLQKPLVSLPPSLQMHPLQQTPVAYSHGQTLQAPMQQLGQLQIPHSGGLPPLTQGVPSQQLIGLGGHLPTSQPVMQHLNIQQQGMSAANQQQLAASNVPHQLLQQPVQQSPTHMMLQQQTQNLQSTFQSTQQAFSQLQQQLQQMQPTLNQQQSSQATKQQSPWSGAAQPPMSSSPVNRPAAVASSTVSTTATPISTLTAEPLTCNWTEHTSPEGYKYYYNSVTKESKWEKPEELTLFEQQQQQQQQQKLQLQQQQNLQQQQQQQQQQKSVVPQLQSQSQPQLQAQAPSAHHIVQLQQVQAQMQIRQQAPTQFLHPSLAYQASSAISHQNTQVPGVTIDAVRVQQGLQAAQEWIWKNKPAGS